MSERYFNREEAEGLLPAIGKSLEEARKQKQRLDSLDEDFSQAAARIMMLGGSVPPYQDLLKKKSERQKFVARIEEVVNRIQEMGCLVKDVDMGLVDFPALRNGREIYLCWKLGEKRIEFWHSVDEGYAGRKPIDREPEEGESPGKPNVQ